MQLLVCKYILTSAKFHSSQLTSGILLLLLLLEIQATHDQVVSSSDWLIDKK